MPRRSPAGRPVGRVALRAGRHVQARIVPVLFWLAGGSLAARGLPAEGYLADEVGWPSFLSVSLALALSPSPPRVYNRASLQ